MGITKEKQGYFLVRKTLEHTSGARSWVLREKMTLHAREGLPIGMYHLTGIVNDRWEGQKTVR